MPSVCAAQPLAWSGRAAAVASCPPWRLRCVLQRGAVQASRWGVQQDGACSRRREVLAVNSLFSPIAAIAHRCGSVALLSAHCLCCSSMAVSCVTAVCYETRPFSTARLARGWIGAYNERPHGDSKVTPCSVRARLGLMRSALAGVQRDQREGRLQQYSAVLAQPSSQTVAAFRPLPQNATLRPGVTPSKCDCCVSGQGRL